jgi:hypothetical protein
VLSSWTIKPIICLLCSKNDVLGRLIPRVLKLVQILGMGGYIPPLFVCAFMEWTGPT